LWLLSANSLQQKIEANNLSLRKRICCQIFRGMPSGLRVQLHAYWGGYRFWCKFFQSGDWKEFLMSLGSENGCPNVRSSYRSARQASSLELLLPSLFFKLDAADRLNRSIGRIRCFDAAMILLHNIVQILAGPYPNTGRAIVPIDFNSVTARCEAA
jgi:hypothetical protein